MEKLKTVLAKPVLSDEDIVYLLGLTDKEECALLRDTAYNRTTELMGNNVYYRGLIEISNICTVNCRYCGIRRDNKTATRYEMDKDEIIAQAKWAAESGYGSICLQAGERRDPKFVDFVSDCLQEIHQKTVSDKLPNGLGITLSLGEQSKEVIEKWAKASGNPNNLRYLARFETSNEKLFNELHNASGKHEKDLKSRLKMLHELKEAGYQVGTGIMIGIPGQTLQDICDDIRMFQKVDADMIGMGPYLMSESADMVELGQMENEKLLQLTLNAIAVTRLVLGNINIASVTALQVLHPQGREMGIEYGCNVVMPNISPLKYRADYQLYDNKPCIEDDPTHCATCMEGRIRSRGRTVGWNLSGSSRKWLKDKGLAPETQTPVNALPGVGKTVWLKSAPVSMTH